MKTENRLQKYSILKELQTIPGVGKSISNDLYLMGFRSIKDLKNRNPEKLYNDFCKLVGHNVDRCLLYTFRCAVYFALNKKHDPNLLLWWSWKDKN